MSRFNSPTLDQLVCRFCGVRTSSQHPGVRDVHRFTGDLARAGQGSSLGRGRKRCVITFLLDIEVAAARESSCH